MLKSMRDSLAGIIQFLYWGCIIACIIIGVIFGKAIGGLIIGIIVGVIVGFLFATCSVGLVATIIHISETLDKISYELKSYNQSTSNTKLKVEVPVTRYVGASKFCKKCGTANPSSATTCKDCGEYL